MCPAGGNQQGTGCEPSTEAIRFQSRRNLDRLRPKKELPLKTQSNTRPAELLTVAETCAALGMGRTKLYKLLKEGALPVRAVRVGDVWRFSRRDVERFCHGEPANGDSATTEAA